MNKLKNFLFLGLMLSLVFSCDKQEDLNPMGLATNETVLYTSNSVVGLPWAVDDDLKSSDLFRAIVTSSGYTVPKLNVTTEEFTAHNMTGHFSVVGQNASHQGSTTELLSDLPTTSIETNALLIRQPEAGKTRTRLNMYCHLPQSFQTEGTHVCLALGGKLNGTVLSYTTTDGTSPNKVIKGLNATDQEEGRDLPIMTNFEPFNKTFSQGTEANEEVIYNPRGVLLGLCFVNKFGEDITIKQLTFPASNALFFEGNFDLSKSEGGTVPSSATDKAKFSGVDEELTFDVDVANATLAKVTGTVDAEKINLPLFYVWGYPNSAQATLKLKVTFTKGGKDEQTKELNIPVPNNGGFVEGRAYRKPIVLDASTIAVPEMINPLAYVADYNIDNTGKAFRTENEPLFTVDQARKAGVYRINELEWLSDFNSSDNPLNRDYTIPEIAQWVSIIDISINHYSPGETIMKNVDIEGWQDTDGRRYAIVNKNSVLIGDEWSGQYKEFYTGKIANPKYNVVCGVRFIKNNPNGGFSPSKYLSVWKYKVLNVNSKGGSTYGDLSSLIIIQSLLLPYDTELTDESIQRLLTEISKPNYFDDNPNTITKTLPGSAWFEGTRDEPILNSDSETLVHYLSKTKTATKNPVNSYYKYTFLCFTPQEPLSFLTQNNWYRRRTFQLRPFYKEYPLKKN